MFLRHLPIFGITGGMVCHGIFDRSSSSTSLTTVNETFNVGLQGVEGPAVANVGGTVNVNTTDGGLVDAGRELALAAVDTLAELGSDTLASAYDHLRLSTDAVRESNRDALGFAADALDVAGGASRDAIDATRDAQRDAYSFVGDSQRDAFNFADDASYRALTSADRARDVAFDFAAETFDAAIDSTRDARIEAIDATRDAQRDAYSFVGDAFGSAIDATRDAQRDAYSFVGDSQRDALEATRDAQSDAYAFVGGSQLETLGFARDAQRDAYGFAGDALTSADGARDRAFDFAAETFDATLGAIERAGAGFVGAVERHSERESLNNDARLSEITKQVLWVGGGIAGVAILGALFVPMLRRAA